MAYVTTSHANLRARVGGGCLRPPERKPARQPDPGDLDSAGQIRATSPLVATGLPEQRQDQLRLLVGVREDRRTGLDQHLMLREVGDFFGEVGIPDHRFGIHGVLERRLQVVRRRGERVLLERTERTTQVRHIVNRLVDAREADVMSMSARLLNWLPETLTPKADELTSPIATLAV